MPIRSESRLPSAASPWSSRYACKPAYTRQPVRQNLRRGSKRGKKVISVFKRNEGTIPVILACYHAVSRHHVSIELFHLAHRHLYLLLSCLAMKHGSTVSVLGPGTSHILRTSSTASGGCTAIYKVSSALALGSVLGVRNCYYRSATCFRIKSHNPIIAQFALGFFPWHAHRS